jgi:hypothetical protein
MSTPLSETVTAKTRERFSLQDRERAAELLLKYGTRDWELEVERIRFDILSACDSNLGKMEELVSLAKADYRDLILLVEYDRVKGEFVSKPQFAEAHHHHKRVHPPRTKQSWPSFIVTLRQQAWFLLSVLLFLRPPMRRRRCRRS